MGTYANLSVITHTSNEFIADFITMMPGLPKPKVVSRIVMTPEHAKMMLRALSDNVEKFEKQFGEIKPIRGGEGNPPMPPMGGFNGGEA